MVQSVISIPQKIYNAIYAHLFPRKIKAEEVAFIFASVNKSDKAIKFEFKEWYRVRASDYRHQSLGHVELKDLMRPKIIKMAFDYNTALVEVHSHPYSQPARFSYSDFQGFEEFVPHVWWRLKGRPYAAIVFSKFDFDALVWVDNPKNPHQLTEVVVDNQRFYPNCLTLRSRGKKYDRRSF